MNAALNLKQEFDKVKETWVKIWKNDFLHDEINLGLKCGIHYGNVLFGLLTTDTRSQITIIGENVNFTSRLENEAQGEKIIVSKEIKDLIANKIKINIVKNKPIQSFPDITELYSVDRKN